MVVRAVGRHIKQSAGATYPRMARFTGNYISISVRLYCCHKVSALDYDCLLSRPKYDVIVPLRLPDLKITLYALTSIVSCNIHSTLCVCTGAIAYRE